MEAEVGMLRGAEGGHQPTMGDHPQLVVEKACYHEKGGICHTHGRGAVRKFRGGHKMTVGRGGIPVKRYQREYYYERVGKKLAQSRLSFQRVTNLNFEGAESDSTSASKEGQNGNNTSKEL